MRYFLLLFALASIPAFAQKQSRKNIPQGFEWVRKRNLLVSQTEITCSNFLEYLEAGASQDSSQLPQADDVVAKCLYFKKSDGEVVLQNMQAIYRDTTFVETVNGKSKKKRGVERCDEMPVTSITYEQALAYCEWLSEKYADDNRYSSLHLNFRLPTPAEMDSLLSDVYSGSKKDDVNYKAFQHGVNKEGCALYNHSHNSWCETNILMKKEFGYRVPIRAAVFFPDMNGLMDLMGNVAEMTSKKGIAKGGSCINSAAECQPGAVNQYEGPMMWLGFRVVADMKAENQKLN